MLDYPALAQSFRELGLGSWMATLEPLLTDRFSRRSHGDFLQWRETVDALRHIGQDEQKKARELLLSLAPWRKGPFDICGIKIDAEWRSNLKWDRVSDDILPLDDRNILDVGCGNGYYAVRMREAGARCVIGVDPTLLYVMQFLAVQPFVTDAAVHVLPLRLTELPAAARTFDTTFSMGVLYHQRSPLDHLQQLRDTLRPGGQLVLETIYLPGEESYARTPANRYARMRNVWLLPTVAELTTWLRRAGFRDVEIIDQSVTSTEEQRTTDWMTFESLAAALDAGDSSRTVEGWPAPRRVVATAIAP